MKIILAALIVLIPSLAQAQTYFPNRGFLIFDGGSPLFLYVARQ
jgi:hypothetical protein